MRDDIDNLIAMLRTNLQASVATALSLLDGLTTALEGAVDGEGVPQMSLLDAIKSQIGVALSEIERFDNAINGQLGIAQNYAQSLEKEE